MRSSVSGVESGQGEQEGQRKTGRDGVELPMPSMRQSQQHPCGLSRTPASQTLLSGSTAPRELPSQMPAHTPHPSASRLEVPGDCLSASTPVLLNQGVPCSRGTCDNTRRSFMLLPLGGDISRVQTRDAADLPAMPRMAQLMQGSAGTPQHVSAATPERPSLPPYGQRWRHGLCSP